MGTANDVAKISLNAFKNELKIKVDHKLLDEITKISNEESTDNN
jgi:hypothetical protein